MRMQARIVKQEQNLYGIEGELNMQTVPTVADALSDLILHLDNKVLMFDLRGVTRSDSAGVALLVDAMQLAAAKKINLQFTHLPQQMKEIAGISGLLEILPITSS